MGERTWSDVEVAWMAGLIEGEGSISFTQRTSVAVRVMMTDEDVIRRLGEIVGFGSVLGPYAPPGPQHKAQWVWQSTNSRQAAALLSAIRPWMGVRRRERIDAALERLSHNRGLGADRTQCAQGHPFTPENIAIHTSGHRLCRLCRNARERRRYADRKQQTNTSQEV